MLSRLRRAVAPNHRKPSNKITQPNMKTIEYTIQFYSQWHCGSGLSAGADVDELTIKDKSLMPFVPGKTMKGLIREAVENYVQFTGMTDKEQLVDYTFGNLTNGENITGSAHFGNAVLADEEYRAIVGNKAQKYLYNKVTTTAIDTDGVAKEHSLRSMETVVPCTLHGSITGVSDEMADTLCASLRLIKRLGQKRNRGLGRCDIKEKKGGKI